MLAIVWFEQLSFQYCHINSAAQKLFQVLSYTIHYNLRVHVSQAAT